ncbi:hypothetical protein M885DRAFT_562 [Pelagophyceae sp. CCMP2097]|nr:hypothetical protein M885DRAFT_562 [Pelagophyceae sp. CCMP2097]
MAGWVPTAPSPAHTEGPLRRRNRGPSAEWPRLCQGSLWASLLDLVDRPAAELDDGAFHLVYTCGPASLGNRVRLLDAFLKLDEAKHVESRFCNVVKCAAFRLEPLAGDTSRAEMCHAALTFCCSPDAK